MSITFLRLSLSSSDLDDTFRALVDSELVGTGVPNRLYADGEAPSPGPESFGRLLTDSESFGAHWGDNSLMRDKNETCGVYLPSCDLQAREVLEILAEVPFYYATADSFYREWRQKLKREANCLGFGGGHVSFGWGCFFQGEGHKRLVSRRWLEHGPWRVLRGANDTTLIQFHDIEADARTALVQGNPGYALLGQTDETGFIRDFYSVDTQVKGTYYPDEKYMEILVHDDTEISQKEMTDACAARFRQLLGEDKPLERVGYVFMNPRNAERHLHQLWLRELECHTYTDSGEEARLDLNYNPTPQVPQWVKELDA